MVNALALAADSQMMRNAIKLPEPDPGAVLWQVPVEGTAVPDFSFEEWRWPKTPCARAGRPRPPAPGGRFREINPLIAYRLPHPKTSSLRSLAGRQLIRFRATDD
jgi:hypothetical protein